LIVERGDRSTNWGLSGDKIAPADYDGDTGRIWQFIAAAFGGF
jgi:hypothetical protein